MLPHTQNPQECKPEIGTMTQRRTPCVVDGQVLKDEEVVHTACATTSSTFTVLKPTTLAMVPAAVRPICPQSASSPFTVLASTTRTQDSEGSCRQEEEGQLYWEDLKDPEPLRKNVLSAKKSELVFFLLLKYRMKEPVTREEMMTSVLKTYRDHFPLIFRKASECMHLVYGMDVKEVVPPGNTYVVVNALGLTYDGLQSDKQSMPKSGLLVTILCVIFVEGGCAREEVVWEALNAMGVYAGKKHFIYGEPRKLITEDLVQEQYLVYRQVPGRNHACYEFLWGPRTHAETSKMKVLKYWAKCHGSDPTSFPSLYEDALRDEREGSQVPEKLMTNTGSENVPGLGEEAGEYPAALSNPSEMGPALH